jgi:phosphoribosylanthranilate isomerase
MKTMIKFCGMTRGEDVDAACELGVDALGFVMWPGSPRHVEAAQLAALVARMPAAVTAVAVFVTPTVDEVSAARDAGVHVIQIHGLATRDAIDSWSSETMTRWPAGTMTLWLASALDNVEAMPAQITLVLDTHDPVRHGGTGQPVDWRRAAVVAARRQVMLAGGLTAANVRAAIAQVRPYGVDVASGIEDRPGIKNRRAMRAFVAAVREADA